MVDDIWIGISENLFLEIWLSVTSPGLIGLISYLYHQVATSFPEAHL
jgi:hypothetical protein